MVQESTTEDGIELAKLSQRRSFQVGLDKFYVIRFQQPRHQSHAREVVLAAFHPHHTSYPGSAGKRNCVATLETPQFQNRCRIWKGGTKQPRRIASPLRHNGISQEVVEPNSRERKNSRDLLSIGELSPGGVLTR
jgi:hypothetical protein